MTVLMGKVTIIGVGILRFFTPLYACPTPGSCHFTPVPATVTGIGIGLVPRHKPVNKAKKQAKHPFRPVTEVIWWVKAQPFICFCTTDTGPGSGPSGLR